jgi:hypothetical protein
MRKRDPIDVIKMVDAIVNGNEPPKLVFRRSGSPKAVALYPENYDWREEERVRGAIAALSQETTPELWEELVRRTADARYCVIVVGEKKQDAEICTVGRVCDNRAYWCLVGVFQKMMPPNAALEGRPLAVDFDVTYLEKWRRERRNKSLYQLQIEMGEIALRALSAFKDVPKDQIDRARQEVDAAIEKLKSTKVPIFVEGPYPEAEMYTPENARRVCEVIQNGSDASIFIGR